MSKKSEKEAKRTQALEYLREYVKPGDTMYTALNSVSRSGMSRHISVYVLGIRDNGKPFIYRVSHLAADILGYKWNADGSITVGGCGMDMGFHVVYSLSRCLFPQVECTGPGCNSNDHVNGDRDYTKGKMHSDGGYAINHAWI